MLVSILTGRVLMDRAAARRLCGGFALLAATILCATPPAAAEGVTPESPEVRALVKKGLDFLAKNADGRLGGKCVSALAFLKSDPPQPNHPVVQAALKACGEARNQGNPIDKIDMYSNGLAIIFLSELGPQQHRGMLDFYLGLLKKRQKGHGGWGYEGKPTGDTSQTQYAALSYWEAHNNGLRIEASSASNLADWLIGTQDPHGGWGYQGNYSPDKPVEQEKVTPSMVAAAMGSALITLDLFGQLKANADDPTQPARSSAFKSKGERKRKVAPPLNSASYARDKMLRAIKQGNAWMDENFTINIGTYNVYYLYSLERYKSFQELLDGKSPKSPKWYQEGYEWLKSKQGGDGSWNAGCGKSPDTAFAILFLVRSTKKMLNRPVGDLRNVLEDFPEPNQTVKDGQLVYDKAKESIDNLMGVLGDDPAKFEEMVRNPDALVVTGEINETAAAQLGQIIRSGSPSARLLATRTLGRSGNLDHVPTLIYAMTDPDRQVTLAARDALRFVSRRFGGFGLRDDYEPRDQAAVVDLWRRWYLSIRPNAVVTLE